MDLFGFGDEFGPLKVIHVHDPAVNLSGVLVVDNVAAGPSIGGLRMAPDVTTTECYRLARAMTLKNAAAGLPHGGGKSVIMGDPRMPADQKEAMIRAFAAALRNETDYIFGPDMGTNEQCMSWVHDEIGRAVGLPREIGGIPLDELGATGWGLYHSVDVALEKLGLTMAGATVVIQGYGSVGYHAARFMADNGAIIIAASDTSGAVKNLAGLDVEALWQLKKNGQSVVDNGDGEVIKGDALVDIACDIWVPAARPDVIHDKNVERLNAKIVAQGANIPVTVSAEHYLHRENVLCLPDFIANAGGVICAAMEYRGSTQQVAFDTIRDKIRTNTGEMLERMDMSERPPREAAQEIAQERVRAAMASRRWSLF
ncbi:MAG: Glu/Leu/Phe/Val dehydrogenase [Rhodospirillaceae bacterium]|nr:Glu/Leu/Phe/Val dehydrogenase [Rhodospirillaceae bacterium]